MVKRRDVVAFFTVHGFINKGGSRHDRYEHPDGRYAIQDDEKAGGIEIAFRLARDGFDASRIRVRGVRG